MDELMASNRIAYKPYRCCLLKTPHPNGPQASLGHAVCEDVRVCPSRPDQECSRSKMIKNMSLLSYVLKYVDACMQPLTQTIQGLSLQLHFNCGSD